MTLIYSIKADRVIEACRVVNTPIAVSALREFSAFALRIANWLVGHISAPLNTNDRQQSRWIGTNRGARPFGHASVGPIRPHVDNLMGKKERMLGSAGTLHPVTDHPASQRLAASPSNTTVLGRHHLSVRSDDAC
jgi:hypothetical protein